MSTTVSISGSGKVDVTVFGNGTVFAGNGNDNIAITGSGAIVVGSGNDTLTLGTGGTITEHGASGHDTIHIGSTGSYTISEEGHATVTGAFGTATIDGGVLRKSSKGRMAHRPLRPAAPPVRRMAFRTPPICTATQRCSVARIPRSLPAGTRAWPS